MTITCGEQSDTCTVTVDITETATCAALAAPSVYQGTSWYSLKYDSTSTIIAAQPYAGSGMENKLYTLGTSQITDIVDMAPISIPPNTATIHLSVKKCQNANNQIYFVDPSQSYTPSGSIVSYNLITSIGGISASSNQIDDDIEVPEGAVAFFLKLAPQSATGATSMTSESDLLAALTGAGTNQMNLTIHYLPEAES